MDQCAILLVAPNVHSEGRAPLLRAPLSTVGLECISYSGAQLDTLECFN